MQEADEVIANKYNELVVRPNSERGISAYTRIERAIWFIISIRCEIDIDGFESVFEQLLSRSELVEAIGYLRLVELYDIAELFE